MPDNVLTQLVSLWYTKIEAARKHKRKVFQKDADDALSFYNGPKDWDELMGVRGIMGEQGLPNPSFKISINKAFELVTIFGPNLYHDNPVRTITQRQPLDIPPELFPDPMLLQSIMQQQALENLENEFRCSLIGQYINLTPHELKLREESRQSIDEALIKGRGCMWTETYKPPEAPFTIIGSFYDSTDNLLVDPDAPRFDKAKWIARRCCHPRWEVERLYNLEPGSLKGNTQSQDSQSAINHEEMESDYLQRKGETNDLVVYWKIWSRMGLGGRLSGGLPSSLRQSLEMFGDNCFLVICKDVPYPLNLPPSVQAQPPQVGMSAVQWPIPFWRIDKWPVSVLDFHVVPNCPWPLSHLKPAFGELKFLNWAMSFLAGKVRTTSRDFLVCLKSAAEEIKEAILKNEDLQLLEITSDHKDIREIVQFLNHPPMNGDILNVIEIIEKMFEQRTGLNELNLGGTPQKQIRSAEEAAARSTASNVRPDDMARCVESWAGEQAEKEAFAAGYMLGPQDIEPLLGNMAAQFWKGYVTQTDVNVQTRRFEIRIESGSTRKPNKDQQVSNMTESLQVIMPTLQNYAAASGDWLPVNNLIMQWAKSRDLSPDQFALRPLPPPMPSAPPGQEGGPPEGGGEKEAA